MRQLLSLLLSLSLLLLPLSISVSLSSSPIPSPSNSLCASDPLLYHIPSFLRSFLSRPALPGALAAFSILLVGRVMLEVLS
ncbi:hypothetical protein BDV06DRAFT_194146 [Aspergillus oleicola]